MIKKRILSPFAAPKAGHFLAAVLIFGISSGIFTGIINNYLHEILKISKVERGIVEFPREMPGLLMIVLVALLYRFSETRIFRMSFLIALAGITGMIFLGTIKWTAILMIILWSTGEHLIMPVRQSMGVHMARPEKAGLALGTVRGFRNTGQLIGFYLIPLLFFILPFAPPEGTFAWFRLAFIAGGIALGTGFILTLILRDKHLHVQRRRLYFDKKFSKYYILEMFFGARKQVFLTFAPFVLVIVYHISAGTLALLYGISATINILVAPMVGQLIDRLGYRLVIVADTVILVMLCLGYGFAHRFFPSHTAFLVICVVFILDAVLFVVTVARTMYVKQLSDSSGEVTATLSAGISINHCISILIAMLGGMIWEMVGIEALFSMAALFGIGSFVFALTLPRGSGGRNHLPYIQKKKD